MKVNDVVYLYERPLIVQPSSPIVCTSATMGLFSYEMKRCSGKVFASAVIPIQGKCRFTIIIITHKFAR